jgi:protein TonB
MRDRVLTYAIVISIALHLGVLGVVGYTYASRLNVVPKLSHPRFMNVDLIDQPKSEQDKPLQAPKVSAPKPKVVAPPPVPSVGAQAARQQIEQASRVLAPPPSTPDTKVAVAPHTAPNPGGKLNTGSASSQGDLNMGSGGSTHVGAVPNQNANSGGSGSGTDEGAARQDPPKREPDPAPAPRPVVPPPPKMVTVEVCSESGMLPGKWCEHKRNKEFVEGSQPTRTCTECKEPFRSTLADRAEPVAVRTPTPDIPSSVEEGLRVSVTISFTVSETGRVEDATVTSSSGNRAIDRAYLDGVRRWKYNPAVQGGIPRSFKKSITFRINT